MYEFTWWPRNVDKIRSDPRRTSCTSLAPMSFQGSPSNIDAIKFYVRNLPISSMGTVEILLKVASSTAHAGKTGDVQSIDICKSFRVLENVDGLKENCPIGRSHLAPSFRWTRCTTPICDDDVWGVLATGDGN